MGLHRACTCWPTPAPSLLFLAPLLVSLALKVNDLVGIDAAPGRLALVTSVGSLLAIVANPLFGRLSDRTTSSWGMRRPWMVVGLAGGTIGILTVALAPEHRGRAPRLVHRPGVPQRPARRPGRRPARPGAHPPSAASSPESSASACPWRPWPAPTSSSCSTRAAHDVARAVRGRRRPRAAVRRHGSTTGGSTRPTSRAWSLRQLAGTFYVNPRASPDFAWAFASRFLLVMAYAFLVTYQAYYLLEQLGSSEDDVPHQIYLGTLAQSVRPRRRLPGHRQAVRPRRASQGLRRRRRGRLRRRRCS